MLDHLAHCVETFAADPTQATILVFSVSLAVAALYGLTMRGLHLRQKICLIYAHLASVMFSLIFFTMSMACNNQCNMTVIETIAYAIPLSMLLAALGGFVVIPFMLTRRAVPVADSNILSFVGSASGRMGIKPPKIYAVKSKRPVAFSFRSFASAIFFSWGMRKLLTRREFEAVLLHELAHLKLRSSVFKLSTLLLRFSPFSIVKTFSDELGAEERRADSIVARVQGTRRHLKSAKGKLKNASS